MRLVLVEWVDSSSGRGWRMMDEVEEQEAPLYCKSVGWLLKKTKDTHILVPHIAGEQNGNVRLQGCGDMTIPNCAITKVISLDSVFRKTESRDRRKRPVPKRSGARKPKKGT